MKNLLDIFLVFAKIGAFTFGGGYAMIPHIEYECVEKRKWLTDDELLELIAVAESTPGPIAINCATYCGYCQGGLAGSAAATFGVVLPSFIIILLLSSLIDYLLTVPLFANAFHGVRIAVGLIILLAAVKMVGKMKKSSPKPVLSFVLSGFFFLLVLSTFVFSLSVSTIWMIVAAGILGYILFGFSRKKEDGT